MSLGTEATFEAETLYRQTLEALRRVRGRGHNLQGSRMLTASAPSGVNGDGYAGQPRAARPGAWGRYQSLESTSWRPAMVARASNVCGLMELERARTDPSARAALVTGWILAKCHSLAGRCTTPNGPCSAV